MHKVVTASRKTVKSASKRCRIEVKPLRNGCDMIGMVLMERLMNNRRTKARRIKQSMRRERGPKSLPDGARLKQNRREMGEIWWKEHMVWLSFIFTGRIKCARCQTVNTSRISLERAFRWSYIEGNPSRNDWDMIKPLLTLCPDPTLASSHAATTPQPSWCK